MVFLYAFAASVMPMWILKQPRDFLSMFLLFGMIIAGVVGVFVTNPDHQHARLRGLGGEGA